MRKKIGLDIKKRQLVFFCLLLRRAYKAPRIRKAEKLSKSGLLEKRVEFQNRNLQEL